MQQISYYISTVQQALTTNQYWCQYLTCCTCAHAITNTKGLSTQRGRGLYTHNVLSKFHRSGGCTINKTYITDIAGRNTELALVWLQMKKHVHVHVDLPSSASYQ